MNEQELEKLAQHLGARAAERLDVERTTQAVMQRLREQPHLTAAARIWMQPVWLKVAATVVLLLGTGFVTRALWHDGAVREIPGVEPASAGLSELSMDQLQELLLVVDQPTDAAVPVLPQEAGLDDLAAPQLRELLRSLEG